MDQSNTRPYNLPNDAVFFITGCSSGIGRALAELIASKPSLRLVATARKTASLASIADGPNVLKLQLDVTVVASVNAAIESALAKFGRLDVVVNNAGYNVFGDSEAVTEQQKRRLVETLFWGTERVSLHAMRVMREENSKNGGQIGGVIMNVSSMGGFMGFQGNCYYHAGKFAVEGFTEALAKEVHPDWNIHFTIIEPGGVDTKFIANAEEVAKHPAYQAPDMPTRSLEKYLQTPETRKNFAPPAKLAAAMYEVVSRGERLPIRVPLGPDAWTMIKGEADRVSKELDELKDLSCGVGTKEQMESLGFLQRS